MKKLKQAFMVLLSTILVMFLTYKILTNKMDKVCGTFLWIGNVRGVKTYVFVFNYRNEKYITSIPIIDCKVTNSKLIKEIECVKFKCSTIFPSVAKCVDKRLVEF